MLAGILTLLSAFQHPYFDGCPYQNFQADIHYEQLGGRWYEHSRYPNFLQDSSSRCTSVDVKPQSGITSGYLVNATNLDPLGNKHDVLTDMYLIEYSDLLSLPMDSIPHDVMREIFSFKEFKVLSTDYTNYAIVYTCYQLVFPFPFIDGLFHSRLVWILTREREPSTETLKVVHNILTESNLSLDPLIDTDQSDCDKNKKNK